MVIELTPYLLSRARAQDSEVPHPIGPEYIHPHGGRNALTEQELRELVAGVQTSDNMRRVFDY